MFINLKPLLESRIKKEIDITIDKNLTNLINLYWKINEKGEYDYKVNEIGKSIGYNAKKYSKIQFDKGIYCEKFVEIDNRTNLSENIHFFKYTLNKEFNTFLKKSNDKTLRKDIKLLFQKRQENEIQSKNKLEITYTENLKKQYDKLNRLEFNCLLIIAELNTKDEIISVFTHKGFNWKSINNLDKLGLLWIKRDFDNKIQDFIIHKNLKNRLIDYICKKGIDIYELEINYM